jgi:hypothetical protein
MIESTFRSHTVSLCPAPADLDEVVRVSAGAVLLHRRGVRGHRARPQRAGHRADRAGGRQRPLRAQPVRQAAGGLHRGVLPHAAHRHHGGDARPVRTRPRPFPRVCVCVRYTHSARTREAKSSCDVTQARRFCIPQRRARAGIEPLQSLWASRSWLQADGAERRFAPHTDMGWSRSTR